MANRINIDNLDFDQNASASLFGWDFQINSAIYLFIHFIDKVEKIEVESKYEDIEIILKNNSTIYAQAKSIKNISNENRTAKLEHAIFSLLKDPADKNDMLLYISNYQKPIGENSVYIDKIMKLKDVPDDKSIFSNHLQNLINKINEFIKKNPKDKRYKVLKERAKKLDVDNFLITSLFPFVDDYDENGRYSFVKFKIQDLLTSHFKIDSSNILRYVNETLNQWHTQLLLNGSETKKYRDVKLTKEELLWQIVAILFNSNTIKDEDKLVNDISQDEIEKFNMYAERQKVYIHERFDFARKIINEYITFTPNSKDDKQNEFVNSSWQNYLSEFYEYDSYDSKAKEFLIKKYLHNFLNNRSNINKIIQKDKI